MRTEKNVISSFSDPTAVSAGEVIWKPIGFTLKGYAEVFNDDSVMRGFFNSLIITFSGVLVNLAVTMPTAYALSRDKFSGKKIVTAFYMVTMFFSGGLIPTYLVIRSLHLLDTYWALILPGCLGVYNMIVARTFFKSNISEELYEAAEIDGANAAVRLFRITIPMCTPMIFYNLVMNIIGALQTFGTVYTLTGGSSGKDNALLFWMMKIYNDAFDINGATMGYACAVSWLLFFVIAILTAVVFKTSRWVFYGEEA